MTLRAVMRSTVLLSTVALALSLSGCVSFERTPMPLDCDPQLVGRWLPIGNTPEESAKLTQDDYALVDAQCRLALSMSQGDKRPLKKADVRVMGFALDGKGYLALSADDVGKLFAQNSLPGQELPPQSKDKTPGTAVTLVRYRIEGDVLTLAFAEIDHETAEKLIKDQRLAAVAGQRFDYPITGDEQQLREVLRKYPELFKEDPEKPMKMRRAPAEAAP